MFELDHAFNEWIVHSIRKHLGVTDDTVLFVTSVDATADYELEVKLWTGPQELVTLTISFILDDEGYLHRVDVK